MRKLHYSIIMGLSLLILVSNQVVKAQDAPADTNNLVEVSKPQDVGNKICPVTGEKIDEKTKAIYEYEGKIYNFCCPMCIDAFKNDPQKYIEKVEEELQAAGGKGEKQETKAMSDSMDMHGGHHH
jgi:YHS domain-containing protein